MNIRRHVTPLLAAAALALSTVAAQAQGAPEAVKSRVDSFRQAQVRADAQLLDELVLPELSYSHSDGRVENREKFIANATSGKSPFTSLEYRDPSITVVGPTAIVRFHWVGEQQPAAGGPRVATDLHILMVWQKQADTWKLLARSATRL